MDTFSHYLIGVPFALAMFHMMNWKQVTRGIFPFLLGIVTILPDLDYFFGSHRQSFTHSLIFPLILLIASVAFAIISRSKNVKNMIQFPGAISILWISHILLDMDLTGINITWPFGSVQSYGYIITTFPPYVDFINPFMVGMLGVIFVFWIWKGHFLLLQQRNH